MVHSSFSFLIQALSKTTHDVIKSTQVLKSLILCKNIRDCIMARSQNDCVCLLRGILSRLRVSILFIYINYKLIILDTRNFILFYFFLRYYNAHQQIVQVTYCDIYHQHRLRNKNHYRQIHTLDKDSRIYIILQRVQVISSPFVLSRDVRQLPNCIRNPTELRPESKCPFLGILGPLGIYCLH